MCACARKGYVSVCVCMSRGCQHARQTSLHLPLRHDHSLRPYRQEGGGRLPAPLAPDRWQFWMETSDHHTEDGLYGFTLKIAEPQIADRGYYLFTGSMKLLDARVGVAVSRPGGARQCRLSTASVGTTADMSEAHHLLRNASHDPDTFNMLGEVLDEVWASISSDVGIDFRESEAACIQLATIVLDLARDGQLGQLQITRTAARTLCARSTRTPSNAADRRIPPPSVS